MTPIVTDMTHVFEEEYARVGRTYDAEGSSDSWAIAPLMTTYALSRGWCTDMGYDDYIHDEDKFREALRFALERTPAIKTDKKLWRVDVRRLWNNDDDPAVEVIFVVQPGTAREVELRLTAEEAAKLALKLIYASSEIDDGYAMRMAWAEEDED